MRSGADCSAPREGCPAVLIAEAATGERRSYYVVLRKGQVYQTIAGVVRAQKVMEGGWGAVFQGRLGRVTVAPPTVTELMEHYYERRTQVVYPKDSGLIALLAGLAPGHVVFEAGTGSGFLTTVLALHVCPPGRVVTVEARRDNLEAARRNLELAGLAGCVELRHGDARTGEALKPGDRFDAVVLDMPDPWAALETLHPHLSPGAPAVVFVPTYNQVEKLAAWTANVPYALQAVYEVTAREIEAVPGATRPSPRTLPFTGFIALLRVARKGTRS